MKLDLGQKIRVLATTLQSEWGGELGVAATFLPTGDFFFWNADAIFPTASVIKTAIVSELYTQFAEGRLSKDSVVAATTESLVAGSGILAHLTPGVKLSLTDCAVLTIALSDNTASNLCLAAVGGPEAVNTRMRNTWGMTHTTIHRPIQFALAPDDPPHTATGSPHDMLHLLTLIEKGEVHSKATSAQIRDLLQSCQDTSMLPRYLEVNPYAEELHAAPSFVVRHKTGAITGVRNDAALITCCEETLAVCVYSKGVKDARWTAANAGTEVVARVGQILCRHFFAE